MFSNLKIFKFSNFWKKKFYFSPKGLITCYLLYFIITQRAGVFFLPNQTCTMVIFFITCCSVGIGFGAHKLISKMSPSHYFLMDFVIYEWSLISPDISLFHRSMLLEYALHSCFKHNIDKVLSNSCMKTSMEKILSFLYWITFDFCLL